MKHWNVLWTFLCLLLIITIAACTGAPRSGGLCDGVAPEESFICEHVPNPENVGVTLRLANATLLSEDVYAAADAMVVVNDLISVLKSGVMTYETFYRVLKLKADPRLFIISEEFESRFANLDILILSKDKELILLHLEKQKVVIQMYMSGFVEPMEWNLDGMDASMNYTIDVVGRTEGGGSRGYDRSRS